MKLSVDEIMSYMAGLVASDGTLSSANFYRVKIITSNQSFANLIIDLFKRIGVNPHILPNMRKFYTRLRYMHPRKNSRLKHILILGKGQAYYIRPPEKERVTAHPPRREAPKIDGSKRAAETPGHPADAGWR